MCVFRSYSTKKGLYTPVFFELGDLCMALFSDDSLWYRGRVEECCEDVRKCFSTILLINFTVHIFCFVFFFFCRSCLSGLWILETANLWIL